MFLDETRIMVKAGDGGKGCLGYARTTNRAFRGPDGGSGGKGGDIYLEVDEKLNSLMMYRHNKHHRADTGDAGQKRKDGRNAKDLILRVPRGTCVYDEEEHLLADLNRHQQRFLIAKGGRGGKGNRDLVTKKNPVPKYAEKGEPGEEFWVKLELKLTAQIGIIGFPNVGKSTLIAKLSNAKPKIADYPFTTLVPNLGMVPVDGEDSILVADIPGIIEGAHEGQGLGHQFLRHIERTGLLLHMIDLFPYDQMDPYESFLKVNTELEKYSSRLNSKHQVLVLNKMDMPGASDKKEEFLSQLKTSHPQMEVLSISALSGEGTEKLRYRMGELVKEHPAEIEIFEDQVYVREKKPLKVQNLGGNKFSVEGDDIMRHLSILDIHNEDALARLQQIFKKSGLVDMLLEAGAQEGDEIFFGEMSLSFHDDSFVSVWASDEEE